MDRPMKQNNANNFRIFSKGKEKLCKWPSFMFTQILDPGADAINIYGLLNPKKLGN